MTLALVVLLSACSTPAVQTGSTGAADSNVKLTVMGDSNPMPGFDAQNKYTYLPTSAFQESDSFFFGNTDGANFLHYYDKSTGVSDFLCADPSCDHNKSTCGAYIASGASMFLYNGQRWWIANNDPGSRDYYLYRSDISGLNQEKIKCLDWEDIILTYQPEQYAIHRGNLFILGDSTAVEGTQTKRRLTLLASPLDGTESFALLFDQTFDVAARSTIRFAGTKVYYSLLETDEPGVSSKLKVISYDIATKEYATVYSESGIKVAMSEPWVTEVGELYLGGFDYSDNSAYVWRVENGSKAEVTAWSGDKYDSPYLADDIAVIITWIDGVRGIAVRDLSGNTLCETDALFPSEMPGIQGDPDEFQYSVLGGDKDKIVMNLCKDGQAHTVLLDIRDGVKITLLWSSSD